MPRWRMIAPIGSVTTVRISDTAAPAASGDRGSRAAPRRIRNTSAPASSSRIPP
jgi:hypothetical protein